MSDPQDPQARAEALDDDKIAPTDTPVEDLEYPPDEPMAVDDYGTTPAEEHVDEPIEERITREVPEGVPTDQPTGRLVDPAVEEVDDVVDAEADAIARDVTATDLSAEESAVHDTSAPPIDDDDGYVEETPPVGGRDVRP